MAHSPFYSYLPLKFRADEPSSQHRAATEAASPLPHNRMSREGSSKGWCSMLAFSKRKRLCAVLRDYHLNLAGGKNDNE
jgi:hypothetical protein